MRVTRVRYTCTSTVWTVHCLRGFYGKRSSMSERTTFSYFIWNFFFWFCKTPFFLLYTLTVGGRFWVPASYNYTNNAIVSALFISIFHLENTLKKFIYTCRLEIEHEFSSIYLIIVKTSFYLCVFYLLLLFFFFITKPNVLLIDNYIFVNAHKQYSNINDDKIKDRIAG